jgi:predicted RNase H-like nuclease (RuvC/YqgF family)
VEGVDVKRSEATKLRASLIKAIDDWWDRDDLGVARPMLGDSTLIHMADAALVVLLAVDDLYETLGNEDQLKED